MHVNTKGITTFVESVVHHVQRSDDGHWLITMNGPICMWSVFLPPSSPIEPKSGMRGKFFTEKWPCTPIVAVELDGVMVLL